MVNRKRETLFAMKINMAGSNKSKKKIIVAVSGGFDPIHVGHVRLFQDAKELGDELIVILNNDNWLKAKKGFVFMPEQERKEIIEAIADVSRVILTGHQPKTKDMSICRELEQLNPDFFANGGDRHKDNIPEVAVCERLGCKMVFNIGRGGKIQSSSWLLNRHKTLAKLNEQAEPLSSKKLLMFDLDGTLTASKADLDKEMASLLCGLLRNKMIAVISGGNYPQFKKQFIDRLQCAKERLKNLFILPTSGGRMYKYDAGKWRLVYKNALTTREKKQIMTAFKKALSDINYLPPKKTYGEVIEDRESQITFSALGQKAPIPEKEKWNKTQDIRPQLKAALERYLSTFEVRLGGLTSVDITKKGIDKAYGIEKIKKLLSLSIKEMAYIGDALYEGGNDYIVMKTGIETVQVSDFEETKYLIQSLFRIKHSNQI